MEDGFEIIKEDATADIAYFAYGRSLAGMYENAALGLFSIITDLDKVDKIQTDMVTVEAEDREALLLDFLNELLYRWDVDKVLFSDFACELLEEDGRFVITAECKGESFDERKHSAKAGVKAVTYFGMEVVEEGGIWRAKITLDV